MGKYTSVNVDVDIRLDDILQDFTREEILDALGDPEVDVDPLEWLNDPIRRLEVIVWLRANGWSVEA